jgi:GNAT superfamily N-acetyltransferase
MTTVRALEAGDEVAWRRLFRDYGVFYETHFEDAVLDRVWDQLLDTSAGIHALVSEAGGAVVGIAHFRSHPDTFTGGRDWFLDDLFVDPEARGQGVATALIEHLTALAKAVGPGTVRWITAETNERAQRVYDRLATRTSWVTYEVRL